MRTSKYHTRAHHQSKPDYTDYYLALAIYTIDKKRTKRQPRIPAKDYRRPVLKKRPRSERLKNNILNSIATFKRIFSYNFANQKRLPWARGTYPNCDTLSE